MAFAELRADEYAALPARALGQPAISLPCGLAPDGMPVAVQIVGPFGSDALVLAFAREVETALAFRERHPLRLSAS
jgi:Asp-tRNA(Asn)/Glu-tRNA(Gln) amidotransferase A subunit family amidase